MVCAAVLRHDAGAILTALALALEFVSVRSQRRNIVRVYPALPLHAACGKFAAFAFGLALGCCLGGGHGVHISCRVVR